MTKARDLANSGTAFATVSATELGFLDGVTSAVQTQIDTKAPTSTATTLTGTQTLTNKTLTAPTINEGTFKAPEEVVAGLGGAFNSGYNYDTSTGTFHWLSNNATGFGALNVRYSSGATLNSVMADSTAITIVLGINNDTTPYYPTSITIDGAAPAYLKWAGGTAPSTGNASSVDWYQVTIIKGSSATFYVFASQAKY